MENTSLLNTKEVAEQLNLTVTTIYQYVKDKRLKPVYDDWSVDGTMLFYEIDVEKIKSERPAGYTTAQAAKILGLHQTTIAKQIKEGKILANKERYRGRMTYFIQEDMMGELEEIYASNKKYEVLYQPDWQYYLFQSFLNEQTKEKARVVEITNESGIARTDSGEKIHFENLKQKGFIPLEHFQDQRAIHRPGDVHFQFEQPSSLHSFVYELIESYYRSIGHRNIKIHITDEYINVYIKPFLLKESEEHFSLMEKHLVSGKITKRHNGILLDSGVERMTIYPSTDQREKVKALADQQGLTMNEIVLDILNDYLNN